MRVQLTLLSLLAGLPAVLSFYINTKYTAYANDFVDPNYALSKSFNETTAVAQQTIVQWATLLNTQGPWAVTTSKNSISAPSGDPHDYLSWAPYWWPNCDGAGNTTALSEEQIWTTCSYEQRDGLFNPDVRDVNNVGAFDDLSNAVLYNSLAWAINGSSVYSSHVVTYIKTWFLDPATKMNPNLNFGQVQRGPGDQVGSHTGVLDLKGMSMIVSGVLILRIGKAPEWTADIDNQLNAWAWDYMSWLENNPIALKERAATNNHGSFYYTQLAALKILVGDTAGAQGALREYFSTLYLDQVAADGEQPLEASRTRPYHYRAYNLAAMITNARLASYVGFQAWNTTTNAGGTIHAALDFSLTVSPDNEAAQELYPSIAAVASTYGDPQGNQHAVARRVELGVDGHLDMSTMFSASKARIPLQLGLRRTYATRLPEKPPMRHPDPLINNPAAVVTPLSEDLTFIHRPPPSAPTPFSYTTNPSSPLLRPASPADAPLPPTLKDTSAAPKPPRMSDAKIAEMRALRASNPKLSRTFLAQKFECTPAFVSLMAPLSHPAQRDNLELRDRAHAEVRAQWGEKKLIMNEPESYQSDCLRKDIPLVPRPSITSTRSHFASAPDRLTATITALLVPLRDAGVRGILSRYFTAGFGRVNKTATALADF
ncbi:chondroitin AC/alginate lyase [Auriscalpium vulgare]|uniref:Chondroitin AC/alginate lyase n=1 Tax=Auriscalpium vulgare TaxID=40419 RepID=A0ACB8RDT1_9AGAM|nr:chondroitin AC/alginate lyase [Auriscalpium vulgare]